MLSINLGLQSFANPLLDAVFYIISFLSTDVPLVAILSYFFWCVDREYGFKSCIVLLTGMQFNFIIKDICKVDRPYTKDERIINKDTKYGYGYSFPSNHCQVTSSALYCIEKFYKSNKFLIFSVIYVILVMISRMYLGVHSVVDVIMGTIIGILITKLLFMITDYFFEKNKKYLLILFAIPGLINIIFFKDVNALKILYIFLGFLIGYFLSSHFVICNCKEKQNKIISYLSGIIGIVIIYLLMNSYLKYFSIGVWISLGQPIILYIVNKTVKKISYKKN